MSEANVGAAGFCLWGKHTNYKEPCRARLLEASLAVGCGFRHRSFPVKPACLTNESDFSQHSTGPSQG